MFVTPKSLRLRVTIESLLIYVCRKRVPIYMGTFRPKYILHRYMVHGTWSLREPSSHSEASGLWRCGADANQGCADRGVFRLYFRFPGARYSSLLRILSILGHIKTQENIRHIVFSMVLRGVQVAGFWKSISRFFVGSIVIGK